MGDANNCKTGVRYLWKCMNRKKAVDSLHKTGFERVLTIFDIVFLCIGSMLGLGLYVLIGELSQKVGPAVVFSYMVAGVAAFISAACYAELAGRAPGTGSGYSYCYITVGEFMAFLVGWDLLMEMIIGTASLVKGFTGYFDSTFFNNAIENKLKEVFGFHPVSFYAGYPDFLSCIIQIIFTGLVILVVSMSRIVNNVVVSLNLLTTAVIIVTGCCYADIANWQIGPMTTDNVTTSAGGFFPYGVASIFDGAATCFYGYTGFDSIATAGEETKNPARAIPLGLYLSVGTVMAVYCTTALLYTLSWPFYDQAIGSPYTYIYNKLNQQGVKWTVLLGASCAIVASTFGSMFAQVRVVYSMSADGLLFSFMGKLNPYTKTPIYAAVMSSAIGCILVTVFDIQDLLDMCSIGTLMVYALVAICVLILRYESKDRAEPDSKKPGNVFQRLFNYPQVERVPVLSTEKVALFLTWMLCILAFTLAVILNQLVDEMARGDLLVVIPVAIMVFFVLFFLVCLWRQPSSCPTDVYQVFGVPFVPFMTVFINFYLMWQLDYKTWLRLVIWLVLGQMIYWSYGVWHSVEPRVPWASRGDST